MHLPKSTRTNICVGMVWQLKTNLRFDRMIVQGYSHALPGGLFLSYNVRFEQDRICSDKTPADITVLSSQI